MAYDWRYVGPGFGWYLDPTGSSSKALIPTDSLGKALTLDPPGAVRAVLVNPSNGISVRVMASEELRTCLEVYTTATKIRLRKRILDVPGSDLEDVAHSLASGTTYTVTVRVIGELIEVYLNSSSVPIFSHDCTAISTGFRGFGCASSVQGSQVLKLERVPLQQTFVEAGEVLWQVNDGVMWAKEPGADWRQVGVGVFVRGEIVSADDVGGKLYLVNGTNLVVFNPVTMATELFTPSAGSPPVSDPLAAYVPSTTSATIALNHFGRLMLAAGQELAGSAIDDPTDFAAGTTLADGAFSLPAALAGKIGEPIEALCSASRSRLLIFCRKSIWELLGDMSVGAQLNRIDKGYGISGKFAVALAREGVVVAHTTAGFMRIADGSLPTSLSDPVVTDGMILSGALKNYVVQVLSVPRDNGVFIFLTSKATGVSRHWWYDDRIGGYRALGPGTRGGSGYFPDQYPDRVGPIASCLYNEKPLLQGRDGYLYTFDTSAKTDDGDAIPNKAAVCLLAAKNIQMDTMLHQATVLLTANSDRIKMNVYSAASPNRAFEDAQRVLRTSRSFTAERQTRDIMVRGAALIVELTSAAAGERWEMESTQGIVEAFPVSYGPRPALAAKATLAPPPAAAQAETPPPIATGPGAGESGTDPGWSEHSDPS